MPLPVMDFSRFGYTPDYSGIGNVFENVQKGREFAEAPHKMARERLRDELMNKIYGMQAEQMPERFQSEMDLARANQQLMGAQTGMHQAHTGLYGAQTQEEQLKAAKQKMILDMISQMMPGMQMPGQAGAMPDTTNFMQPPQQQGAMGAQGMQMPGQNLNNALEDLGPEVMPSQDTPQAVPTSSMAQSELAEALMANMLGFKPEQFMNEDGDLVTQYIPGGAVHKVKAGPTKGEIAEQQESGKLLAQEKEKILTEITGSYAKEPIFQELMEIINSPEFYQGTGPVLSRIRNLTDNKEVNEMAGRLNYLLGDIVNKASKQFGARLNKSEYNALQRMKGSDSQNPYEIRSKVMLMNAMDKFEREVNTNYYRNLEKKMNKLDAKEQAYKDANYSEIRNIVKLDDLAHKAARAQKSDYGTIMKVAERFAAETDIPIEEALEELGEKRGK